MLQINELSKSYGKIIALDNVSVEFDSGIYGLLGPNGAGKSTLMNIITLVLNADKGTVLWDGSDIASLGSDYRSILGFMPQQQGLYDMFTGYEFLNYIATLKAIPKKKIKDEVDRAAALTNMTDRLRDRVTGYSGGMKQRILLASSVIGDPKLIILDEPTAGLDPKERVRTRELISSISKDRIVIVATHVVSDIETIADEVLLMKKGKIIEKNTPELLCEEYGENGLEGVYMQLFADDEKEEIIV